MSVTEMSSSLFLTSIFSSSSSSLSFMMLSMVKPFRFVELFTFCSTTEVDSEVSLGEVVAVVVVSDDSVVGDESEDEGGIMFLL